MAATRPSADHVVSKVILIIGRIVTVPSTGVTEKHYEIIMLVNSI